MVIFHSYVKLPEGTCCLVAMDGSLSRVSIWRAGAVRFEASWSYSPLEVWYHETLRSEWDYNGINHQPTGAGFRNDPQYCR